MGNFFSKMALIAVFTATNASNLSPTQSKVQSKGIIKLDYVPKKEYKEAQEKAIKDETYLKGQDLGKIINDYEAIPHSNMDKKTESKGLESVDSVQMKKFKEAQEAAIRDETFLNGQEYQTIINDWQASRYSNMNAKTESKGPESLHSAPKELVPININTLMSKNRFNQDAGIKSDTFLNRKETHHKATADKATRYVVPKVFKRKDKKDLQEIRFAQERPQSLDFEPKESVSDYIKTLMTENKFKGETMLNPKEIQKMIHKEAMTVKRFKPKETRRIRKLKK